MCLSGVTEHQVGLPAKWVQRRLGARSSFNAGNKPTGAVQLSSCTIRDGLGHL